MTLYLNCRVGGSDTSNATGAYVIEGNAEHSAPGMRSLPWPEVAERLSGRNLLFAAHGFNVTYVSGLRWAARLEDALRQAGTDALVIGVLWPGDFWLPVINYPAEAEDAVRAGRRLATFVDHWCKGATSVSLVSHSLGARLVLEAIVRMQRKPRDVCLTAAAVDADCLSKQYREASGRAGRISVLASKSDKALSLAYPLGDFVSDILYDDDSPFRGALGREGPRPRLTPPPVEHAQIPPADAFDHGDYFEGGAFPRPQAPPAARWRRAVAFVARSYRGDPVAWR